MQSDESEEQSVTAVQNDAVPSYRKEDSHPHNKTSHQGSENLAKEVQDYIIHGNSTSLLEILTSNVGLVFLLDKSNNSFFQFGLQCQIRYPDILCIIMEVAKSQEEWLEKHGLKSKNWLIVLQIHGFIKDCVKQRDAIILKPCLKWAIENEVFEIPNQVIQQAIKQSSTDILEIIISCNYDLNKFRSSDRNLLELTLQKKSNYQIMKFLMLNLSKDTLRTVQTIQYYSELKRHLIKAVQDNDLKMATCLLQDNTICNFKDNDSRLLLTKACSSNNVRMAQVLVDAGAFVDHKGIKGWTALMESSKKGYLECVKVCFEAGANVAARDDNGTTALLAACSKTDNTRVVEYLLSKGSKLIEKNNSGKNAVIFLAESRSYYTLRDLLHQWINPVNDEMFRHLFEIYKSDNFLSVHHFLTSEYLTDKMTFEQIEELFLYEMTKKRIILESNPLCIAILKRKIPSKKKSFLIHQAIRFDQREIVVKFLSKGFKYDKEKITLLDCAKYNLPFTSLDNSIDEMNKTDRNGNTILHCLVDKNLSVMRKLLEMGHDPNVQNEKGQTPLHLSVKKDFIILLCEHGASLDIKNKNGLDPWEQALLYGDNIALGGLIDYKISCNKEISLDILIHTLKKQQWGSVKLVLTKFPCWLKDTKINNKVCASLLSETCPTIFSWFLRPIEALTPFLDNDLTTEILTFVLDNYEANKKGDINESNSYGTTLLMYACHLKLPSIVQRILKIGVDVNIKNSAVFYCQCSDCLKLLLREPIDVNVGDLVLWFCRVSTIDCLKTLLAEGLDPNGELSKENSLFYNLIESSSGCKDSRYDEIIRLLIENGYDINHEPQIESMYNSLTLSCKHDYLRACQIIMNYNPSLLNKYDGLNNTPLQVAIQQNNLDILNLLIRYDVDPNILSIALKTALNIRSFEAVYLLLEYGASGDIANEFQESLILLAIQSGTDHGKLIFKKLSTNKDIILNAKDSYGRSLAHLALGHMKYLLPYLDPLPLSEFHSYFDVFGRSPIHCWRPEDDKDISIIKDLYRNNHAINKVDYNGHTALHLAYIEQNKEIRNKKVKILKNLGIQSDIKDKNNLTALDMNILRSSSKDVNNDLPACEKLFNADIQLSFTNEALKNFSKWGKQLQKKFCDTNSHTKFINHLMSKSIGRWSEDKLIELRQKANIVLDLFKEIGILIAKRNPLLRFEPKLSGSSKEGTKVNWPDEMDILCIFENWFPKLIDSGRPCPSFLIMFNGDGDQMDRNELFEQFYYHFGQVLIDEKLWKKYPNIYRINTYDISHTTRSITPLQLIWHGKHFPFLEFCVDVVPCFKWNSDLPLKAIDHPLLYKNKFCIVPKFTIETVKSYEPNNQFQVSFNISEADLFTIMPSELKQGYMMAKTLKGLCPGIDYLHAGDLLSSYMLKTCAFTEFKSHREYHTRIKQFIVEGNEQDAVPYPAATDCEIQDVVYYAQQIFSRLEFALQKQELGAFFLPSYNLLGHKTYKENYRPSLIARICRTVLSDPKSNMDKWNMMCELNPQDYPDIHAPHIGKIE